MTRTDGIFVIVMAFCFGLALGSPAARPLAITTASTLAILRVSKETWSDMPIWVVWTLWIISTLTLSEAAIFAIGEQLS